MPVYDPPGKNRYPDIVYSDDQTVTTDMTDLNEPLLTLTSSIDEGEHVEEEENILDVQEESIKWSKCYSLIIGLIIGCFIQFSSLGANFLMTSLFGQDVFFMKEFVVISLLWCFVTSIMGVCVLLFLRSLVVTSFYATATINSSFDSNENFIAKLIQHMEYHFAVGSLIGVCTSWTVTDIILGMKAHVAHSLITLFVALVWCRLVLSFCGGKIGRKSRTDNNDKSQVTIIVA